MKVTAAANTTASPSRCRALDSPAGRTGLAAMAVLALAVTACTPESAAEFQDGEPVPADSSSGPQQELESPAARTEPSDSADAEVLYAEIDDPLTFEVCEQAEDSDDAHVMWLEDVVVEEQRFSATPPENVEVSGTTAEIPGAPAVVIPERVAQAGCIIEYAAPGGCLPAFEISAARIPGYSVPERVLPGVELPDGTQLEEIVQEGIDVDTVEIEGLRVDEVCQDDEDAAAGDIIWGVTRWGDTRWGDVQWGTTSWGDTRWGVDDAEGNRLPTMVLEPYNSETTALDTVRVETDRLETYQLKGAEHTERAAEHESTSYITEGDVLFASDEYELRDAATAELQAIAEDIAERDDDYVIEVEGHTDDLPTAVYADNYELSELRAESVVEWLVENTGVPADVVNAKGLGEDYPRADNATDLGRQQNRRVVITVRPAEGSESSLDYQLEEAD